MRGWIVLLLGVTLVLAPLVPAPTAVRACQISCTPINLVLRYLPNLSNWGPQNATGVVELVLSEAEARGRVTGLPRLEGEVYQAVLVNTSTDEALRFGAFNTDEAQRAQFRFILDEDIPDRGWNLFLITVQTEGQPAAGQAERRGIGAYFIGIEQQGAVPSELPNTGGDTPSPASLAALIPPEPATSPLTSPRSDVSPVSQEPAPAASRVARPAAPVPAEPTIPRMLMVAGLAGLAGLAGGWWLRRRRA